MHTFYFTTLLSYSPLFKTQPFEFHLYSSCRSPWMCTYIRVNVFFIIGVCFFCSKKHIVYSIICWGFLSLFIRINTSHKAHYDCDERLPAPLCEAISTAYITCGERP